MSRALDSIIISHKVRWINQAFTQKQLLKRAVGILCKEAALKNILNAEVTMAVGEFKFDLPVIDVKPDMAADRD